MNSGERETNTAKLRERIEAAIDKLPFMDSQGNGPLVYRHEVKKAIADLLSRTPTPERNLTEYQKAVEEAAGMPIDWSMANAPPDEADKRGQLLSEEQVRDAPQCTGPFSDARDCPVHGNFKNERRIDPQCSSHFSTPDGQLLRCQQQRAFIHDIHESGDWEWKDEIQERATAQHGNEGKK